MVKLRSEKPYLRSRVVLPLVNGSAHLRLAHHVPEEKRPKRVRIGDLSSVDRLALAGAGQRQGGEEGFLFDASVRPLRGSFE